VNILQLIVCILLCGSAGLIGGLFTARSVRTWYPTIAKPWFNPPAWVFGPAWTLLYLLMGISLYLVWRTMGAEDARRAALLFFFLQLLFNAGWSVVFFGMRRIFLAFVEICVLWILIAGTVLLTLRISAPAAYLLIPYLLWVTFALVLNYSIWRLNGAK